MGLRSRPLSNSRFMEGSMNDRASAAPPVRFLDPSERASLEQPLPLASSASAEPDRQQPGKKTGSSLLGQVWEGVRDRFRLRRDDTDGPAKRSPVKDDDAAAASSGKQPSREDVMASYHQLVASGFFSSHATHASRPPGARPATSHRDQDRPPQWPLTPAAPPPAAVDRHGPASPVCSPASASSRGTKRAASPSPSVDGPEPGAEPESDSLRPGPKKRLRKMTSRDISLPKLRGVSSKRSLRPARRSVSAEAPRPRGPNKLVKRPPPPPATSTASAAPASGASAARSVSISSVRTRASHSSLRGVPAPTRVLRSRNSASALGPAAGTGTQPQAPSAAPLSVIPDANRGIPSVPAIPLKFTYGEDRENGQPWRGLRR